MTEDFGLPEHISPEADAELRALYEAAGVSPNLDTSHCLSPLYFAYHRAVAQDARELGERIMLGRELRLRLLIALASRMVDLGAKEIA